MKLASSYAHALYDLQKEQELSAEVAVSKLIKILKHKGHIKLLPSIAEEFEKIIDVSRNESTTSITCAKSEDFKKYKGEMQEHLGHSEDKYTKEIVDATIIGGFILRKGETIIDGSYKKKLLLLYQNAIA